LAAHEQISCGFFLDEFFGLAKDELDGRHLLGAGASRVHPHDLQRLATDERRDEEDKRRRGLLTLSRLLLEAIERAISSILDEDESGDHGLITLSPRVEVLGPMVVAPLGEATRYLDPSTDDECKSFLQHETS
jgi:hypothetical protein